MAPHGPEGACCAHDHDCEENECSAQWTLNQHVDTHKVRALNERVTGSCKDLFRTWDERLDTSKVRAKASDGRDSPKSPLKTLALTTKLSSPFPSPA